MTLTEAADKLGVAPSTLRSSIHRGTLTASKKGRDWHVTPGEVERYRHEHLGRRGRPAKAVSAHISEQATGGAPEMTRNTNKTQP